MINIYEVISKENDYPLFFKEHIERFHLSIKKYYSITWDNLWYITINLTSQELKKCKKGNLKLIFDLEKRDISIKTIKSRKPNQKLYTTGAKIGIFDAERGDPLIKQENKILSRSTDSYCKKHNLYDVLLSNKDKHITEGSRSNFLIINKKGQIVTSRIGDALNGITRDKIFYICRKHNIEIIEEDITYNTLKKSTSLIITGTSPEILPIIECGDICFDIDNSVIKLLKNEFEKLKSEDLKIAKELFNK